MRKVNIPMVLACVLLCLTLISIHLTSGLYARYTTTATASDSARVARFEVEGTATEELKLDCRAKNGEYIITVQNNSEVTVEYILYVTMTANPEVVGTDFSGTMTDVDYKIVENEKEIIKTTQYGQAFSLVGTNTPEIQFTRNKDNALSPGASREHHITITPAWSAITGKEQNKNVESVNWEIDVSVRIEAKQVD